MLSNKTLFAITIAIVFTFLSIEYFRQLEPQLKTLTETPFFQPSENFSSLQGNITTTIIKVPAVDAEGNGVVTQLKVQAVPGEGRALVNINQILFWVDTQFSIRVAKQVAEKITKVPLNKFDLIYSIETEATVIEGQSAGAALTIATVAALTNKTINQSVIITGTINPDGTIGPVGGILAKANAAKSAGAKLFLVPAGQGMQTTYTPVTNCQKIGSFTICRTEYKAVRTNVKSEVGIEIREVSNIDEALKYFLA
jgi:uncharacterized protein